MVYRLIEEASEAVEAFFTDDLKGAKEYADSMPGKHLILDEEDNILYDTQPEVSYKI